MYPPRLLGVGNRNGLPPWESEKRDCCAGGGSKELTAPRVTYTSVFVGVKRVTVSVSRGGERGLGERELCGLARFWSTSEWTPAVRR